VSSISWQGRILTGDALYCQIELCEMVLADGGDYLVVARGNQPQLLEELEVTIDRGGNGESVFVNRKRGSMQVP